MTKIIIYLILQVLLLLIALFAPQIWKKNFLKVNIYTLVVAIYFDILFLTKLSLEDIIYKLIIIICIFDIIVVCRDIYSLAVSKSRKSDTK